MKATCECCGAKTVVYKHSLSSTLVGALKKLEEAKGRANLEDLDLSRYQWVNFQKLRYWGLVEQVRTIGSNKRGIWAITIMGNHFLGGIIRLQTTVHTYRGSVVKYSGAEVSVNHSFEKKYKTRREYAEEAVPMELK